MHPKSGQTYVMSDLRQRVKNLPLHPPAGVFGRWDVVLGQSGLPETLPFVTWCRLDESLLFQQFSDLDNSAAIAIYIGQQMSVRSWAYSRSL